MNTLTDVVIWFAYLFGIITILAGIMAIICAYIRLTKKNK